MMITLMGFLHLLLLAAAISSLQQYCMGMGVPVQLNDDVLGLIVFKSDLHDPSSYLDSWNEDDDSPCSWEYIQCNPVTSRVSEVSLDGLGLSGKIGRGLEKLQHLKVLSLSRNNFSGTISPQLTLTSGLERLNLSHNSLSGNIPSSLVNMSSIRFLDLSKNSFTGPVPDNLFQNCVSMRYLSLAENMLEGSLPSTLSSCSFLNYLNLSKNSFTGNLDFASWFGSLKRLRILDISNNALSGSVPAGISAIHNLKELLLEGNHFSGPLPFDIGLCLHLNSLPSSMGYLKSLNYLSLSDNKLSGNIPMSLVDCTHLSVINLRSNNFHELGFFQNLTILDLRNNALFGPIPEDICDSGSLGILQLDGNTLTGPIPEDIGNCTSLYLLLPVGGIFQSLDGSSLQGNLGICSPLLKGPCKMNVPKPLVLDPNAYGNQMGDHKQRDRSSKSTQLGHHKFLSVSAIVAISAAIIIAIGVIVITLLNVSARQRLTFVDNALESMCSSSSRSASPPVGKLIMFDSGSSPDWISNPESLLNKASEIGSGVFGTVYKASFGAQGGIVAIKKLATSNIIQYPEDFDREVKILGKAKHPNLIALMGYYWTPQTKLLVTEYAPNGSLQAKLHERLPSTPSISWANRVNEKCDVYGFGMMIFELVTGRRPVEYGEDNVVILSDHVRVLLEQGNVLECVDHSMSEYQEDEVLPVLKLALVCTSQIPSSRPSMTEVVQILQVIKTPVPQRMEIFYLTSGPEPRTRSNK
ncbi:putativeinactive leucine-rich repeat receptor-like protein kinase, partial [Quercus suber]